MTYHMPVSVSLPEGVGDNAKNIYSRMAIYFDYHIHDENRNDDLLLQYLYHILYMLACKSRYFKTFEEYDGFALFAATRIYLRAITPLEDGSERIKSILNYAKSVLYPMKVDYLKEEYDEVINPNVIAEFNSELFTEKYKDSIKSDYQYGMNEEVCERFKEIPKYIAEVVKTTPFKNDPVMCRRLYMSILITFLKGITLSNKNLAKIKSSQGPLKDSTITSMFYKDEHSSVTLWKIEESLRDYIYVLTREAKRKFSEAIYETTNSYELSDEDVVNIMMTAYNTEPRDDSVEEC